MCVEQSSPPAPWDVTARESLRGQLGRALGQHAADLVRRRPELKPCSVPNVEGQGEGGRLPARSSHTAPGTALRPLDSRAVSRHPLLPRALAALLPGPDRDGRPLSWGTLREGRVA